MKDSYPGSDYPWDNHPGVNCPVANFSRGNCLEGNYLEVIVRRKVILGGNCPRGAVRAVNMGAVNINAKLSWLC